ncbi:ABC transporter permease [Confluentibacter sediminis]|uniref:ABC transporter permease n=1 Tax=Confluentibacter sediminis TaxID=2219045 RepID=UPI000DAC797B|nr:ABC transporter permease [Confluentibacter sediminis]
MFKNYFKIAWRNILRSKGYAFINILGLSLGLACAMLIMLYVKDEVSYDKFHSNVDDIYRVVSEYSSGMLQGKNPNTGYLQGPYFSENTPEINEFVRIQGASKDFKLGTDVVPEQPLNVDPNFFSMFSFPVLYGNPETCLQQPKSVVISEDLAIKYFGKTSVVGETLMVKEGEDFEPYAVTAVTKRCPQNSSIKFDILLPMTVPEGTLANNENWFSIFLNTFVSVKPNVKVESVNNTIQNIFVSQAKETANMFAEKYGDKNFAILPTYSLQPFTDMHLNKELPAQNGLRDGSNPMYSYILSAIALFVLLIACINFVNLTVARSVRRSKEIGIRKVVGGDRKQLIVQFLGESFLLCFMAFALAVLLVQLILPVFNDLSNKVLAISYLFDTKLLLGFVTLFIVTTLLAGFYPALILSKYKPVDTLYSRFVLKGKNYLQKSLVVLQFTLASFLIVGTFVIYKQFSFLTNYDLGYDDSNIVEVQKYGMTTDQFSLFKSKLMSNPNIVEVAGKNAGYMGTSGVVNGDERFGFAYENVSESYIPTLNINVVSGRNFSSLYASDAAHSALVNESFVKKAGWQNPLGQIVKLGTGEDGKYTVIGVVKDYHFSSLNQLIQPQLFTMHPDNSFGKALIKIKPGNVSETLSFIESAFKETFPLTPYNHTFMDEVNKRNYQAEAKWKQIVLFGAVLTIFISCIGLFGLTVLSVEKRAKEIGIRKVLGASVNNILGIVSRDFIKLVSIALVIAMPLGWLVANKWLESYPYRIMFGWQIFVSVMVLVILVALLTVSFQALKVALANPVKSLRTE